MAIISNIQIGTKEKRSFFPLSRDIETTSGFGFCQPTIIQDVNANTSSVVETNIGVRLAPLPCPTFGRIRLKTYNVFVPHREVFEAFDYMIAQKPVSTAIKEYVPEQAPYIMSKDLLDYLIMMSFREWSKSLTSDEYNTSPNRALFNFTVLTNMQPNGDVDPDNWIPLNTDGHNSVGDLTYEAFRNHIRSSNASGEFTNGANMSAMLNFYNSNLFNENDFPDEDHKNFDVDMFFASQWEQDNPLISDLERSFVFNRASWGSSDMISYSNNYKFSVDLTLAGIEATKEVRYCIAINWTVLGQRIFKILTACGLRGFEYNVEFELTKIFSYYKAWFDIMNPGRVKQWKQTNCYKLIHFFYDTNLQYMQYLSQSDLDEGVPLSRFWDTLFEFFYDCTQCCYVLPVDNFTVATDSPQQNVVAPDIMLWMSDSGGHAESKSLEINQEYPFGDNEDGYGGLNIHALLRLYYETNKNSVLGSQIEDYLRTKYGYTIPKSNFLGSSEQAVQIEETFASVTNEYNFLGEIGGRGSNNNTGSDKIKFEANEFGTYVQFICIVPFGDYVQGNVKAKVNRIDFYQPEYDSITMEPLYKHELLSRTNVTADFNKSKDAGFGFVPQYWRDKVANSQHNGAFALPSQRDNFLAYSLDRLFNEIRYGKNPFFKYGESPVVASEELRYIGRATDMGNYDRIFVDTSGAFDNFIIHCVVDYKYYAPMKAISQSYDTFDDEQDTGSRQVSHS